MVKNTLSQRLRGSIQTALPQDIISIYLDDQRLQFVVADHLGQAHLIKEYISDPKTPPSKLLSAVFSEDKDLRKTYRASNLILLNTSALLEPNLESDQSHTVEYFLPKSEKASLTSDVVEAKMKVTYHLPNKIAEMAAQMFPNLSVYHHHTLLIQLFGQHAKNLPGLRPYIQLNDDKLSIFVFKDARLQFANQFDVLNDEDCIYYIMLVLQQFEIDPSGQVLYTSIGHGRGLSLRRSLEAYVRTITPLEYIPSSESGIKDTTLYRAFYFQLSASMILSKTLPSV